MPAHIYIIMHRSFIFLILLFTCNVTLAQQQIQFTEHTTWKALLKQARDESKLIIAFTHPTRSGKVPAYYDSVLHDPQVASYLKANFISVVLSLKKEENKTPLAKKMWDVTTTHIYAPMGINHSLFLIYDQDGRLLHIFNNRRKDPAQWLSDLAHYSKPENQYFTQVQVYKKDTGNLAVAKNLYKISERLSYRNHAIHKEIGNFIVTQTPADSLFTPGYANLIYAQLQDPGTKAFEIILNHKDRYQQVDTTEYIDDLLAESIIREYVLKARQKNVMPEESKIDNLFKGTYKNIDYRVIKNMTLISSWLSYGKYATAINRIDSLLNSDLKIQPFAINDWALQILKASGKPSELNKALGWITSLCHQYPDNYIFLETQAHLLYKSRRTQEAVSLIEKIIKLQLPDHLRDHFNKVLEQMKSGRPTW